MNPYPIETLWQRGQYLARLTGPDPKYVVGREFLKGKPVKTRGTIEFGPNDIGTLPAWLIQPDGPKTRCPECGGERKPPVQLIAAWPHGYQPAGTGFDSHQLLAIVEAGPPGTDDAWQGDRCPCGQPTWRNPDGTSRYQCHQCEQDQETAAHQAGAPAEDPF